MRFHHPEKIASKCKHIVHPSSSSHTPWCSQCIVSSATEDLERSREAFEAEGGPGAPAYMRDLAWNVARLRHAVKASRVDKVIQNARLRDERERVWEKTHRQRISKAADNSRTNCIACDATKTICLPDAQPIVSLTIAWWEREGAYEAVRARMVGLPTHIGTRRKGLSRPHSKPPSCLRSFIKSCRERKTVSEGQRQAWEDRCKLDRAIRRKYDLADDYDIDPEVLDFPIPASHASYHHRRAQESQSVGEQRANRRRRREEGYKPSRSSLALTELAEHVILDETEVERLRLVEKVAELRRSERVAAAEVGYLYFIGSLGLLERWKDDIQQSNLSLIYRKNEHEHCQEMVYMDRNRGVAEDDRQL